jgi:hypothetical protein
MRQKGEHPIVDTSFIIRSNLDDKQPIKSIKTTLNDKGHGIIHLDAITELSKVRPLLKQYFDTKEFRENADYMKVIAWRNKTVAYINNIVRELLYGMNPPKFVNGEKLVANKPVFVRNEHDKWKIVCYTSEELEIEKIDVVYEVFHDTSPSTKLKMYRLAVSSTSGSETNRNIIYVVHEDSEAAYAKVLNDLKIRAISMKQAPFWVTYYDALKWSANVTYNYALSAHKSQGSTYKNILVLENDLDANRNIVERNRIKYTAYTRATDVAYVLREN